MSGRQDRQPFLDNESAGMAIEGDIEDGAICPQCFGSHWAVVEQFSKHSRWLVVGCSNCGQMYTYPGFKAEEVEQYYLEDYPPHRVPKRTHPIKAGPRAVDPYLPRPWGAGRLLEVGCGVGEYLAAMRARGWSVLGIDRSQRAVQVARDVMGVQAVEAVFPSEILSEESFDLIALWQVLEHLDEPRFALAWCREHLARGGRLAVSVPNQGGWAASLFGSEWFGLDLPRHRTHFTAQSLAALFAVEGFELVKLTTIGRSGWIRHSTRNGTSRLFLRRMLASRFISRLVSAASVVGGRGEALFVLAQPV